jgi:MerR family mercuric resistance operon transcriptional regulator
MAAKHDMGIGALSRRTGVHIETIRYYERIGLMPAPPRRQGRFRVYAAEHAARLIFVRRARALGFPLDQVRALLTLAEARHRSCGRVKALAVRHLDGIRTRIADLRALADVLDAMVASCERDTLPDCPIIEALASERPRGTPRRPGRAG